MRDPPPRQGEASSGVHLSLSIEYSSQQRSLCAALRTVIPSVNATQFLIVGDFKGPDVDRDDCTSTLELSSDQAQVLETFRDTFMYQHVTEPTHYRPNCTPAILDLV